MEPCGLPLRRGSHAGELSDFSEGGLGGLGRLGRKGGWEEVGENRDEEEDEEKRECGRKVVRNGVKRRMGIFVNLWYWIGSM